MGTQTNLAYALLAAATILGCSKDEAKPGAAASASASAAAPPPSASAAPSAEPSAAPSASALPPRSDCPKGSSGPGTFDKPCEGTGTTRMMEAVWTGKIDDKGPHFRITNKYTSVILYGKVTAYFYDKAGKQLEVKDTSGKTHPFRSCGGNIFGGVMKAGEKAVLTFSCLKKETVPEGATAIEAEVSMVGFADSTEKSSEFYWRNEDLVPETRKKGGVKGK
jgi:hypothetical protein